MEEEMLVSLIAMLSLEASLNLDVYPGGGI